MVAVHCKKNQSLFYKIYTGTIKFVRLKVVHLSHVQMPILFLSQQIPMRLETTTVCADQELRI